jgi:hypothetical protein
MKQQKNSTMHQIVEKRNFTLLELLDRLLDKGVMVKGEILLSVADIDLVYLNLGLLLSSVKTVEQAAFSEACSTQRTHIRALEVDHEQALAQSQKEASTDTLVAVPFSQESCQHSQQSNANEEISASILPPMLHDGLEQCLGSKANIDPKNVEKGLAKLVLTLVDLLRKLMEKQAIRRMEADQLNAAEVEKMGHTFLVLDERIEQIKAVFGLQDEELNVDLGPLGELL